MIVDLKVRIKESAVYEEKTYPNTLMFETVRNVTIVEQSRHL